MKDKTVLKTETMEISPKMAVDFLVKNSDEAGARREPTEPENTKPPCNAPVRLTGQLGETIMP